MRHINSIYNPAISIGLRIKQKPVTATAHDGPARSERRRGIFNIRCVEQVASILRLIHPQQ